MGAAFSLFFIYSSMVFGVLSLGLVISSPLVFVGLYGFRSGLKVEDGVEVGRYLVWLDQEDEYGTR